MKSTDNFLREADALNVPWVDSPMFSSQVEEADAPPEWKRIARQLNEEGYALLEGFIEEELVDRIVGRYEWLFDPKSVFDVPRHTDEVIRRDPKRRQDAWAICPDVLQLACHPRVLEILRFLYRREAIPFQTLNFREGSQQRAHSDAIHFDSLPPGFMCGVWVALEDVTDDNGPLFYYPGSHRLPPLRLDQLGVWPPSGTGLAAGPNYELYENYVEAAARAQGLRVQRLHAKKGTALIWSANLFHGGSPIERPGSTRLSQVTHYYFEGCSYYAPILSRPNFGELHLKHVYDLHRKRAVPHTINGEPMRMIPAEDGLHRLGFGEPEADGNAQNPGGRSLLRGMKKLARRTLGR